MLAHLRIANIAGVGQKPPDLAAVIACSPGCHDLIDGRIPYAGDDLNRIILEALCRTLSWWAEQGVKPGR